MNIVDTVAEFGAKNIRVFLPMSKLQMVGFIPGIAFRNGDVPCDRVECRIVEDRYTVADNYKIQFEAIDTATYGKDSFYISDLESLTRAYPDEYQWYALTIDGYHSLKIN